MSKFVIVSASHRADSQSRRLSDELNARYFDSKAEIVDLLHELCQELRIFQQGLLLGGEAE